MDQHQIEAQIKAIPGNEPVLEKLYKLLESGEAIALVGAGASAGLWPLWDEFLNGFIEHSLKLGKITQPDAEFFKKEASKNPLEIAQQLRSKLDDRDYFEYLQETFKDKNSSQTGGAYTLTHKALLQMPILNYLTLNYDAGLTNARDALYPKATTSYFFWDQEEAVRIRDKGYKRLVLHAHGRHDRTDSIILTLDDYRKAYDNRAFVRLLDSIFAFEKLLIIGFGMSDPYIKQLFNNISKDYKKSPLRHIALVDLDNNELPVAHLKREQVEMVYGAHVLFYPKENYHRALTEWLTMLVEKYQKVPGSLTTEEIVPLPALSQIKAAIQDKYVHRPTDDEYFKGRKDDFALLNRWANDPETRMIAITGIGGQGKTAMIGRWLKTERSDSLKQLPVFYWSFYEDLDIKKFLDQVVKFCSPIIPMHGNQEIEPISFILSVVQQARLLLVLDGLEVLQEDISSPNHGKISHPLLYPFLHTWVREKHLGLMLLTSRFHFPQLEPYSGIGYHHLELVRLSKEDGVALLRKLYILGEQKLLENYVEKLYGHPLALRVLASTLKRCCHSDLSQFNDEKILMGGDDDKLSRKLEHLLGFYEQQLKNGQKELMGIISLFKRPVETKSFITLLSKMKSLESTPLAKANANIIQSQLNVLIEDFLIERTNEGITTHPIIRDYFRKGCNIVGSRREVADFLQAKPGAERPRNIEEVRDLVEAVQLLCDEGEFKAADDLVIARLAEGGYGFDVFQNTPAINEGLECDLAFVGDETRRKKVEEILGKVYVGFHCSGVAVYNRYLGNLVQSIGWWYKCLEIRQQQQEESEQATIFFEISSIEMVIGNIEKAKHTLFQSLNLSSKVKELDDLRTEFAYKAYYEFLLGNTKQAFQDFEIAYLYYQKKISDQQYLVSISGIQQAEFYNCIRASKQFKAVNRWNVETSKKYNKNETLSFCLLLQGWYEISQGQISQAEKSLVEAEHILKPSGMLQENCRLDWVWGLLAEAKEDYQKGFRHVNDALHVCADKGYRLWQADHLILRGRLYLMQFEKENQENPDLIEKAGDDGLEALKIADETGYIWAKLHALKLLSSYHQTRANLANYDANKENQSAQRYIKEAASIEQGLYLTEEQMIELQAKAKEEFEKQTAGWDWEKIRLSSR